MNMMAINTSVDSAQNARLPRNEFIQIMRFVAAALVLFTHTTFYYSERVDSSRSIWHFGEIGVPIFFVISGVVMVMSSTQLPLNLVGSRQFMARRLLRILPLYWLATLIKVTIALWVPSVIYHNHFDVVYAIKSFLFIPAYNPAGEIRPIHGVGWTLLHEMFFYLVFAAMLLVKRKPVVWASGFILSLYLLGLIFPPGNPITSVVCSSMNLYFIVGMWVGAAMVRGAHPWLGAKGLMVVLAGLALLKWGVPLAAPMIPLDPLVLSLGSLMLLLAHSRAPGALHPLVALGESSYALYLFHPFLAPAVLLVMHRFLPALPSALAVGVTAVIVIGVAHLIHRWVELPLNHGVRRVFWGPAPHKAVVGVPR